MRILVPLPDRDFDITEVSVPWRVLTDGGHRLTFATEQGRTPAGDPRLITGVLFGRLGARPEVVDIYRRLIEAPEFREPTSWAQIEPDLFDGLLLCGGHAPGMRQYLGSQALRSRVLQFWLLDRPVGAICHGVLVLARTIDPMTGRSVIASRRTTCLPKYMERGAHLITGWRLGRYYRTYPAFVEDEVRAVLAGPDLFQRGPRTYSARDTTTDTSAAFVVEDGNYISARWPGDAHLFARRFQAKLEAAATAAG
ncbi:MAG: type 1 glutamine amidotransferase domain-containing protein [Candidatus Dormiibacterota bacterium]